MNRHIVLTVTVVFIIVLSAVRADCTTGIITFSRTFSGTKDDNPWFVQQTLDGGYIMVGTTLSFGAGICDVWLIKTDYMGNEEWTRTFGGSGRDKCYSIQQTSDEGYIIIGTTEPPGTVLEDVLLIKTNSMGYEEWSRTYGGSGDDVGRSVKQTFSDGGYIITGWGTTGEDEVIYLLKTDSLGILQWKRTFGNGHGYSVQQTIPDGGYIITGQSSGPDVCLIKTDSEGYEEWSRTYGGSGFDRGRSVQQTSEGGYIIGGTTESFGAGSYDGWLIKTNSEGYEEWSKTYGGSSGEFFYSVQQTSEGGYIITGGTKSFSAGDTDVWLIKTYPNGDEEWTRTFGDGNVDIGQCVQQTSDKGYVILAETDSFGTTTKEPTYENYNFWLIKTDSLGNVAIPEVPYTHWKYLSSSLPSDPFTIESAGTQFTDISYTFMTISDDSRVFYSAPYISQGEYEVVAYRISAPETATTFQFTWEGFSTLTSGGTGVSIKAYNYESDSWQECGSTSSTSEETLTIEFSSEPSDYIEDGIMWIMIHSKGKTEMSGFTMCVDYVDVVVVSDTTSPTITIDSPMDYGIYPTDSDEVYRFYATDDSGVEPEVAAELFDFEGSLVDGDVEPYIELLPSQSGLYTLAVTATDGASNQATESVTFVVYDPSAGFATGGGWITPEVPDEKASFGFVAKYHKGSTTPDGNLEFQYKYRDMDLKSVEIDWLVISSNKALFQGTATIKGWEGVYTFRVHATDGDHLGNEADNFRIKIWSGTDTEGDPVYDYAGDLVGGNIKVHQK